MNRYQYGRRVIDSRNQYHRWIDPRVWALRREDAIAYLIRRGWMQVPPDREGFLVFQEPQRADSKGGSFYQFVPDSEQYDTYPQLMFDLLTGVAEFEDRQASEVIDDILRGSNLENGNGASRQSQQSEAVSGSSATP